VVELGDFSMEREVEKDKPLKRGRASRKKNKVVAVAENVPVEEGGKVKGTPRKVNRFKAVDEAGYGYFYEQNSKGRIKPEHPILKQILKGKKEKNLLLPKGYIDESYWLTDVLLKNI
jgi:hypothetical protein